MKAQVLHQLNVKVKKKMTKHLTKKPKQKPSGHQPASSSSGPVLPIALPDSDPDTENDDDETDRGTIYYPDHDQDLLVLEEKGIWETLPDDHKIVSNTSSLSFATTFAGDQVDVLDLATSPSVSEAPSFLCTKPDTKPSDELLTDASYDDPDEVLLSQLAALDRSLGPNRANNQNRKERRACFKATKLKRPDRSRKEATATDQKKYLKDFLEAKLKEYQSWVDNDVFELVDLRKAACKKTLFEADVFSP